MNASQKYLAILDARPLHQAAQEKNPLLGQREIRARTAFADIGDCFGSDLDEELGVEGVEDAEELVKPSHLQDLVPQLDRVADYVIKCPNALLHDVLVLRMHDLH